MYDGRTNYIGGQWCAASNGATFPSLNPADTEQMIGIFARSGAEDVRRAVEAAEQAYPQWSRVPKPARAALLLRMGRLLEQNKEGLARLMVLEMGKVLEEARGDVQEAIDMAYYMAGFGRMPDGYVVPSERPDIYCAARRVPVGVVGVITPWNFPIAIPSWKIFPALLAGNTVVFKPSEETPGLACRFVELLIEAGLPDGVLNLVTGYGSEAGMALVEAKGVRVISFTGSTAVGKQIASRCGEQMKRVSCELGGKNAILVLEDADLELGCKGAVWGAFATSGQRCTAASRILVQRSIKPRFLQAFLEHVARLRVGSGLDPNVEVGPVINRHQLERIHEYVQIGKAEGAEVVMGGTVLTEGAYAKGCYYAPTVLDRVTPKMRIAQEEIFGPVTAIMEVDDLADALTTANATAYGLSLSVYTGDVRKAFRAIEQLEAGLVYVNLPTSGAEIQLPFGGVKQTGNGSREAGWVAMDYCTEWKSVYINYSEAGELVRAQIDTPVLSDGDSLSGGGEGRRP
ncbi:MAG TPA: aldehyde dehydrogenase family protein [Chthonomonas sp.]|uniref:aldehyde dehydrogenase family protein n=1 Tax=Chthonomonas sp. TaxID=2282153 RepID=UPI002B4B2742|nr:aldehyde dehydrogenase family protein [Chthonomonas sp.]HLH80078.1 aldehyde dehydrogenase family protein [Chthonomonas sp.]